MKHGLTCSGAAFLAAGLPWWTAPYNHFSLSHPLAILGCLAFVAALLGRLCRRLLGPA